MKLAIENKKGQIKFYKIDGRSLPKFIEKAKRDIEDLTMIWSYDRIDRDYTSIGAFIGVKCHYENVV